MTVKRLLIATGNQAKLEELKFGLKNLAKSGITLITLNDVRVEEEVEETGHTFRENSEIKARFYSRITGFPTIADDGGLTIPHLNGEPGVKSKRWLGREASDRELIDYTLLRLRGVSGPGRTAYLETCITFYDPKTETILFEQEKIKGHISETAVNVPTNGYPFRALFIVDRFNKFYDDLTLSEHDVINHRFIALKALTKRIKDLVI